MTRESKNLEVHVVDHCNLDCVGCSHESPLMASRAEDPDRLASALTALWQHYRAPLVKLLGGEPLLHPRLGEVVEAVRRSTDARVRVVTNGTLLRRRWRNLVGVDEVHVSLYPGVELPPEDELLAIASDIGAPITTQAFDTFRWHRVPSRHDRRLTQRVFETCQLYQDWECHTLRDGWFYPCPPAATWSRTGEGVDLHGHEDIPAALDRLLDRHEPLGACASCLGSVGRAFPHRQGWRSATESPVDAMVDGAFLVRLEHQPDAWNDCHEYQRTVHPSGDVQLHPPRRTQRRSDA